MDARRHDLTVTMAEAVRQTEANVPAATAETLLREHDRWLQVTGWNLINDATPQPSDPQPHRAIATR